MLSNHCENRTETARFAWSRLPHSDDGELDGVGLLSITTSNRNGVESLDYERALSGSSLCSSELVSTGLAAVFINISVENFTGWKFALIFNIIQKSYLSGCPIYILINLALVFSSVYIITQFAPAAAGSGIPEIKGYLNGVDIHGILLFRTLFGKIFGSIGSVGGGLALGKEGPLVHTGACIASLLGQLELLLLLELLLGMLWDGVKVETVDILVMVAFIWDISDGREDYSFEELLPMELIGVIGGFLGALFNQLTLYVTRWRRNYLHKKGNRVKIYEACLISVLMAPGVDGNYVNFYCSKDKEYNDLATIFFNTQDNAIRNLFSAKTIHEFSAQSLLTFLVMFYTLAVVTFGTAVPAGQFVPGIMIGSTYGRLVGIFTVNHYKKLNVEEGTYALLGAASFLGGSMRMTVSLTIEGHSLLESRPKYEMRKMTAQEVCGNQKVVDHTRNGEPLVIGIMLRSHLLVLLQSRIDFQHSPLPCHSTGGSRAIRPNYSEFAKPVPVSSKGISINDIYLSSEDLEMYIDLAPFLNPSPYVVPEDMSLTKVYNLFRQLGLRHIFVVPRASRVIGVITRKDLLIEEGAEYSTTTELQSTSVSGQRHERSAAENGADLDRPLLNGLLVQHQR
ncbi:Chloride channel protein CLC-d [Hibiscus syriacus]|uniref:Chloride channel protein n=1 Tax=Hibiscus syriacus TaxID=106335 RepID=A0A6A3AG17_HIBSY|nr:Chloride channel protein CLC-d [Hibiscus syriacus]